MNKLFNFCLLACMCLTSCFKAVVSSNGSTRSGLQSGATKEVSSTKSIASVAVSDTVALNVSVGEKSSVSGSNITFPPGSLSIATNIIIEQGADLADTSMTSEVSLTKDVSITQAGNGVVVRPSEPTALSKPLQISLPLPVPTGLRLNSPHYAVYYKYFDPTLNQLLTGYKIVDNLSVKIVFDEITKKDQISFEGYFGVYWVVLLSREVVTAEVPAPKVSEVAIVNKSNTPVIASTGIVTEAKVLVAQARPEVVWEKPILSLVPSSRKVQLKIASSVKPAVKDCSMDAFESPTDIQGLYSFAPDLASATVTLQKLSAHRLIGRFRCIDGEGRTSISPWSDPLAVPAYQLVAIQSVSSAAPSAYHGAGSVIPITVSFNQPVFVKGVPSLLLNKDPKALFANYKSGSGSSSLVFEYTSDFGDQAWPLEISPQQPLGLSDASILDSLGVSINPDVPSLGSGVGLAGRGIYIDTFPPDAPQSVGFAASTTTSTALSFSWTAPADPTRKHFNTKLCALSDCSTSCSATEISLNSPKVLSGTVGQSYYACVQAEDQTGNLGVWSTSLNPILIQSSTPVVTAVTSSNANGNYPLGSTVVIRVQFNLPVTVTNSGDVRLLLETGTVDRQADYAGGSGTDTLTFNYLVQSGDYSPKLDVQSSAALTLGATGLIRGADSSNAVRTLPIGANSNSLWSNKLLLVDGIVPPIPTLVTTSTTTNQRAITFTGSGVAGDVALVRSNAVIIGSVLINGSGQWTYTHTFSNDGTFTIYVDEQDPAGNVNGSSNTATIVIDTQPPVFGGSSMGFIGGMFKDVSAVVTGAVSYQWSFISGPGTITFNSPTSLSTSVTAPSTEGNYVIRLTATDAAGNWSYDTYQVMQDITPPTFAGISQVLYGKGNTEAHLFWAPATDNVSNPFQVTYYVCVSTVADGLCSTSFPIAATVYDGITDYKVTGLDPTQTYEFAVKAKDLKGQSNTGNVVKNNQRLQGASSVSLGNNFGCAVVSGTVRCWGTNTLGTLGNGTYTQTSDISIVAGITNATSVVSGANFSCAVLSTGTVKCWGANESGQLGDGSAVASSPTPVTVAGLTGVVNMTAGYQHACAVKTGAQTVFCWGINTYGQLGDGTNVSKNTPVQAGTLNLISYIFGSGDSVCAQRPTGNVFCWGRNHKSQLGDGTTLNRSSPVSITLFGEPDKIAMGPNHTCILLSGTVRCVGANEYGQLGGGNYYGSSPSMVPVPGTSGTTDVFVGPFGSCALKGSLSCWGGQPYGNLGTGDTNTRYAPTAIPNTAGTTAHVMGSNNACSVVSGELQCWGDNNIDNKLGHVVKEVSTTPIEISSASLSSAVSKISQGLTSSCALRMGVVFCWGDNDKGQLGNGIIERSRTPVAVSGVGGAMEIEVGSHSACALIAGGAVKCWGENSFGQLGQGDTIVYTSPVTVQGLPSIVKLSVGEKTACGLTSTGQVYCWGGNAGGQLGDGTVTNRSTPVLVAGLSGQTAVDVSVQYNSACAVLSSGVVKCWGYNGSRQLGDGTSTSSYIPVTVVGVTGAVSVKMGHDEACAIKADSTVSCWGYHSANWNLSGLTNVSKVSIFEGAFCALTADKVIKCWGKNTSSQLGLGTIDAEITTASYFKGSVDVGDVAVGRYSTCYLNHKSTIQCVGNSQGMADTLQSTMQPGGHIRP